MFDIHSNLVNPGEDLGQIDPRNWKFLIERRGASRVRIESLKNTWPGTQKLNQGTELVFF